MNRRTLLSTVGAGLAAAVAGCTGAGDDGTPDGNPGDDGTATGTADGDDTATGTADPTTDGAPPNGTDEGSTGTADPATDDPATDATTDGEPTRTDEAGGDATLTVTGQECGGAADEASVSVDGDAVTVDGLIRGADGCHTARLADPSRSGETLTVPVETYVPESETATACVQCLVDIEYTATVPVAGDPPDSVVVVHDGERVTTFDVPE